LGTHGDGCEDLDEMLGKGVVQTAGTSGPHFSGCFKAQDLDN